MTSPINRTTHIRLTSHPGAGAPVRFPIRWGVETPAARGPVVGSVTRPADRNVIGTYGGAYALYRGLAVAAGALNPIQRPDLRDTAPVVDIPANPAWHAPGAIVALDPWGHMVGEAFAREIAEGVDIRPTIAVTRSRLTMAEIAMAIADGRLAPDGEILRDGGEVAVTKIAIDPVWHLPGIAHRFNITESALRRVLFEQTGGMYPELVTRPDLEVFLPPIGGATVYIFGDPEGLADPARKVTCRVHDECNGSDVFGSDICTCRPYLIHGIEECIRGAQAGGTGLVIYNRKEGRALGEVTKFLVYNARKRAAAGDTADAYFERTECVAGVQDARFQELMPDVFHWLGVTKIDRFVSMSNMKYEAVTGSGVAIGERVPIPPELVPEDAHVEIEAKKAAGYYSADEPAGAPLSDVRGRGLDDR
ncbi:GTP cyclohydrolase II [Amorphus orientalis]|uniref:GTP cyclohydrolase II n=1 Tax=Amorphus orientalis TaxID=649198 RepID=A0AAE4AUG6_9HYPH|nr:GTP cyclohydrolase II [Amorphus orientalis]MDQ0317385.1 GTP cyclohydrolase II [Amorphus orientalis]